MKIKLDFKIKDLFFTSDPHFFHDNIRTYCERPFKTVLEMNEELIENWNAIVPPRGVVFLLGDVSLGAPKNALYELLSRLNGTIYLIKGNHERDALQNEKTSRHFQGIYDIAEITVKDDEVHSGTQDIIMCHYAMMTWPGSHRGSWQLFGHSHGTIPQENLHNNQIDVGVDSHNYAPISYQTVKEIITKNNLKNRT